MTEIKKVKRIKMKKIDKKTQMKKCQIKCFIFFQLNNEIKLNSIHFNRSFRSFKIIKSIENTVLFLL